MQSPDLGTLLNDAHRDYLVSTSKEEQSARLPILIGRMRAFAAKVAYTALGTQSNKELVTEAVHKAFMNLHQFRGDSQFHTWLTVVVHNMSMDFLRKKKLHGIEVQPEEVEGELIVPENPDARILMAHIRKGLNPEERALLEMKLEEYKESEIAEKMGGWDVRTVGIRWKRLKEKVRKEFPEAFSRGAL